MASDGDGTSPGRAVTSRTAIADHIAAQVADLWDLAKRHDFHTLEYFLDMARGAAQDAARADAPRVKKLR